MNTRARLPVVLHWASVSLLLIGVAAILLREAVESRTGRLVLMDVHRSAGLLVLALVAGRLWIRWRAGPRREPISTSSRQRWMATGVHALLYVLMAAIPLIGWRLSGAMGQDVRLLGISLPAWGSADEDIADRLSAWHERFAWGLAILIGVHVGAALWHHFILKDDLLATMAPWRDGRLDDDLREGKSRQLMI